MTPVMARQPEDAAELAVRNNNLSVHRLHNELLSEIFLSVDLSPLLEVRADYKINSLTSVCSLWRHIALSTPRLWADIAWQYAAHAGLISDEAMTLRYERLSTYFNRSKSSSVRVSIYLAYTSDATRKRMWAVVTPHLHRCSSLSLMVKHWDLNTLLPLPRELPRLRRLHISEPSSERYEGAVFENCTVPTLQELYLSGPILSHTQWSSWKTSGMRLNLQVVRIFADHITFRPALNFLEQCPNLTSLILRIDTPPSFRSSASVVTLSRLSYLEVSTNRGPLTTSFIDAPQLENIRINVTLPSKPQADPQHRTYPLLKILKLSGSPFVSAIYYQDVLSFCRANPTIEKLELVECSSDVLDAFLVNDADGKCKDEAPNLRRGHDSMSGPENADPGALQPSFNSNSLGPTTSTCVLPGLLRLRLYASLFDSWGVTGQDALARAMRALLCQRPLLKIALTSQARLPPAQESLREEFGDRFDAVELSMIGF